MTTSIKITALSNIGTAISYTTLIPVVNMSGTPETQKANLQITGNLILAGAGGSNFVPAALATLAENVSGPSQPNITQVGTLSELVVSGNVQSANANLGNLAEANFFSGDGGLLSNLQLGSVSGIGNISSINLDGNASNVLHGDGTWSPDVTTYSNSNVVNLLAAFGSNTVETTGNITGGKLSGDYVEFRDGGGATESYISESGFYVGSNNAMTLATFQAENVSIVTDFNGSATTWTFGGVSGNELAAPGNISTSGIFNGDGYGLSNIAYANITGTPSLGNISSVNLDGNSANVLRGDGTFSADANSSYGDSNVVTLLGSFGSNTVDTTGNISAGNLISTGEANVYSLYVSAGGANIQSSVIINGDITSVEYIFANANVSTNNNFIALGDVFAVNANVSGQFIGDGGGISNIALANVSGAGNIAAVNLDGNSANVLTGAGTFTTLPVIDANTVIWSAAPVSNTSTGTAGQAAYDSGGNLYICVATDTWAKFTGTLSW